MPTLSRRVLVALTMALALAAVAEPSSGAERAPAGRVAGPAVAPPVVAGLIEAVSVPAVVDDVVATAAASVSRDLAAATLPGPGSSEVERDTRATRDTADTPSPQDPSAPAPPPPAPAGSVQSIIHRHFGEAAGAAIRVADCESGLDPGAVSPTDDHGLFQINAPSHRGQFEAVTGHPWSAVYDPAVNTAYAKWLHDQQGWRPWACRRVL